MSISTKHPRGGRRRRDTFRSAHGAGFGRGARFHRGARSDHGSRFDHGTRSDHAARLRFIALAVAFALALSAPLFPAAAQPLAPPPADSSPHEAMYENLFTKPMRAEWFSPLFLAQVPVGQIEVIVGQYVAILGPYEGVTGTPPEFTLHFAKGTAPSVLSLNAGGQVEGLWFGPPQATSTGLDDALAPFHELPGRVSVLVASENAILSSIDPDVPLAVGSAFKLAVAAALKAQVDTGRMAWDDVVYLDASSISLPSGLLQNWPPGTALTVESLAALMISVSDNTATDALIRHVGREAVETFSPRGPLLTTREAFTLKAASNEALLEEFRAADEAGKRALLDDMANLPLPALSEFRPEPTALDVEWYFTATELLYLMAYVQNLPFMAINPGLASPDEWEKVTYKGGSEPGVLNFTTLITAADGTDYIVVATWNDEQNALDENRFALLYTGLLNALKQL